MRLEDLVKPHSEALVSMIGSNDPGLMQDSWELLDILLREGITTCKEARIVYKTIKEWPLASLGKAKITERCRFAASR
ncbi:hypothetical protein AG1IA_08476 [Rhizoctonia solani AG-1 IA]|uniref:Uncharacterized protein n=1 Tax=Thanatephorus cucumeris (strain AG1-IA) TaxID=983506 RepID=L8WHS3_THACA|nr:hypothetical protein AG1IA_08476 [Rhizoctonia solani AG-1 IA]